MSRAGTVAALAGLAAAAVVAAVIAPFGPATIDPDASASVLYFERLIAGARLEAFVPTTPKSLLTLVDGVAWSVTGDWRVLTWIALGVLAVAIALSALLVWRSSRAPSGRKSVGEGSIGQGSADAGSIRPGSIRQGSVDEGSAEVQPGQAAGALAGSAFIVVALGTWSGLALEVARANSIVPAIACWAAAGVALVGPRRRPAVAGVALLLGGAVRFETLAIVGGVLGAAVLVALAEAASRRRLIDGPARWSRREVVLIIGLGALAVPVACLHDALLTGDPFYWIGVPARYTQLFAPSVAPMSLAGYLSTLGGRLAGEWPLVALAAVGAAASALRRALVPLVGLGALVVGMVVLLAGLAVRGIYISNRYYEPLDVALLGFAAFGVGGLVELGVRTLVPRPAAADRTGATGIVGSVVVAVAVAVGVVVGAGVMGPPAPWDPEVAATLAPVRAGSEDLEANLDRLVALLPESRGSGASTGPSAGAPRPDPREVRLFVPSTLRARVVVATGASLTAVGDTLAAFLDRPPWDGVHAGQWLYHDPAVDRPAALTRALDTDPPQLAGVTARVAWMDASSGVRLLRIDAP